MKKTHLLAATALVTALLLGASAQAATPAVDPAAAHAAHIQSKAEKPMRGPMHEMMVEMKEENKELFDQLKTKREELHKIAAAPTFDKEAYLAKHEEMQSLHAKLAKARAEAMAAKLEGMKPEERAKMPMMGGKGPRGMMRGDMMEDCPMMKGEKPEVKK